MDRDLRMAKLFSNMLKDTYACDYLLAHRTPRLTGLSSTDVFRTSYVRFYKLWCQRGVKGELTLSFSDSFDIGSFFALHDLNR